MELRETILTETMEIFKEKGLKLTMDDIAKRCSISKKTIYTIFKDKEALFLALVDDVFDRIKESEEKVLAEEDVDLVTKLRKLLGVLPAGYQEIDVQKIYSVREKYPKIYKQLERRLESGWEQTVALLEEGIEKGYLREINIPLFKMMFEAAVEQFFQRDFLKKEHISYQKALHEVVDILMDGILQNNNR